MRTVDCSRAMALIADRRVLALAAERRVERRRRRRRRLVAIIAFAGVALGVVASLVLASPADAIPFVGDCKDAPEPESPRAGLASFFQVNPPFAPPPGDPFVEGSGAAIVEQYGHAGLTWSTYDLGCGGAARDPWNSILTGWASLNMDLGAKPLVMATGAIGMSVIDRPDEWLRALDGPLDTMAQAVHAHPFAVFLPIAALLGLAYYAAVAHKTRTHEVASHAVRIVLTIGLATFFLLAPLRVAYLFDGGLQWGARTAQESTGGTRSPSATTATIHRSVLYTTWLAGEFGSSDSLAAKRYGADLFKTQAYSFDEWDRTAHDPEARERIRTHKMDTFKEIAAKIEKEDPDAYRNLQGKAGSTRLAYSFLGAVTAMGACLFVLVSFVMLGVALVTIRLFVVALPLAAIPAMLPQHRGLIGKLANKAVGAAWRALIYIFAGGAVALLTGAVLGAPNTSGFVKLLVVVFINVAAWVALLHWYARRAVGIGKLLLKAGVAGGASGLVAGKMVDQHRGGDHHVGPPHWDRPPPPEPGGALVTLPPPPRSGNGFEMRDSHPGYDLGEARVRGAALPPAGSTGHDAGPVRVRAPGLPSGTPSIGAARGGLVPIDVAPVVHNDGSEVYIARPRTSTRHGSLVP